MPLRRKWQVREQTKGYMYTPHTKVTGRGWIRQGEKEEMTFLLIGM